MNTMASQIAGINAAKAAGIGKIIAVDSIEPIEFYRDIDGLSGIITSFDEVDKSMFEIPRTNGKHYYNCADTNNNAQTC